MQLIGICGKKGSGKTTLAKDIEYKFTKLGNKTTVMSMATPLKEFCQDDLGLRYEQLWGTEEQKNTLTKYKWEDLPHYQQIFLKIQFEETIKAEKELEKQPLWCQWYEKWSGALQDNIVNRIALRLPFGYMTARQIIQEWGTGVFRKINSKYWVEKAEEEIERDQSEVTPSNVIAFDDIRFSQECEMIKSYGGTLVKLMRGDNTSDKHASENLEWSNYDIVIPNNLDRNQTLEYFSEAWKNVD